MAKASHTVVMLSALALAACNADTQSDAGFTPAPVRVLVQPLVVDRAQTRIEAVGTSRAIRSVEVHSATSGEVDDVLFEPGQFVEKGAVLVELDRRDESLAVDLAGVRLQDAERLNERYLRSADSGAVLPTQLDTAQAAVESASIELQRARIALDYRTIRAPLSGHVDVTDVFPGDRINPDTLITTVDDRSALLVSFEVPELLIGELETGTNVELSTWNRDDRTFGGKIVEISSRINPGTRTFLTRATVDNSADTLRPGMSFRVSVNVAGASYPVVAETAVQWGADGAYVWTVVAGKAQRIPVQIVQRQQGKVLIDADLDAGEPIIVEGIQRMRHGIDVVYDETSMLGEVPTQGGAPTAVEAG